MSKTDVLYARARVAWLSQCIEIDDKFLEVNEISKRRSFSHSASFPVAAKAMNSDSIVECVMQVCFFDP